MAPECPNKKDGDSGDTSWKKGKNAVKRFKAKERKAKERKANMQAKRMKKLPPPNMEDDGRWVRLNCTAARPVKVPGRSRCSVVNDGDEFLVSDDTLKTIGIDIDACWNWWRAYKWMKTATIWKKLVAIAWSCPSDRPSEPRP
ncbi:hypothetical protein DYB37_012968 [Aphanomyces astaci]|uniref:Uncharacterized protein n=1 Tax=Aphanomyces astaci TaxID=112090 RepID=A0A3R7BGH8_APHAT|nr:hypothetical protein DYB35_011201 [Aphanomyces astaci]RHZ28127.1 hypothetical protein DYB37_012968 [Aphanomyces astaci]